MQFGYGLNYLIDIENAIIVDVVPTPTRTYTYDEVEATKTMPDRTERCFNLKPKRLAADTAYGTGRFLGWLVGRGAGAKTLFIEPGSLWENGYCESFNGKLRDELLNGEIFYSLKEAQIVIEQWRTHYNCASQHPPVYVIEEKRLC